MYGGIRLQGATAVSIGLVIPETASLNEATTLIMFPIAWLRKGIIIHNDAKKFK